MNALEKLKRFVDETANTVHYDTTKIDVGGTKKIDHGILTLETLTFVLKSNAYIMGNPGTGKTSSVNKLGSLITGIPLSIADAVQIRGSPEETKESIIGRPDFGELSSGREKALFAHGHYFLFLEIDEINRLKAGKQNMLLQGMQSGIWVYMDDFLMNKDRAIIATGNHQDEGNGEIIAPLMDRFGMAFEIPPLDSTFERIDMKLANKRAAKILSNSDIETKILKTLMDKQLTHTAKQEAVAKLCSQFQESIKRSGVYLLSEADKEEITEAIEDKGISNEGLFFLEAVYQEINFSHKYGFKRPSDPPLKQDDIDYAYAGASVKRGIGNRAIEDMYRFTKAFAFLDEAKLATPDHAKKALKYVLNHRLEFTPDFESKAINHFRKDMMQMGLTDLLLEEIGGRFNNEAKTLVNALYHAMGERDENGKVVRKGTEDIEGLPRDIKEKVLSSKYPPLVTFRRKYLNTKEDAAGKKKS
ncbi:AAA family ATPase [Candidatus Woesearchaeota archaeon]|nr:AAA family ATPase [Candidatus Woesearchaeota archaeon]